MIKLGNNYQVLVPARDVERMEQAEITLMNLFPHKFPVHIFHPAPDRKPLRRLMLSGYGIQGQHDKAEKSESYFKEIEPFDIHTVDEVAILIPGTNSEYMIFQKKVATNELLKELLQDVKE